MPTRLVATLPREQDVAQVDCAGVPDYFGINLAYPCSEGTALDDVWGLCPGFVVT